MLNSAHIARFPFGRKVRIAAALLGLEERIAIVAADTNDPAAILAPAESARQDSGAGPARTARRSYDSRVIVEYLDWLAGGGRRLIPAGPGGPGSAALTRAGARRRGRRRRACCRSTKRACASPANASAKWRRPSEPARSRAALAALRAATRRQWRRDRHRRDRARLRARLSRSALRRALAGGPSAARWSWLDGFAAAVPAYAANDFSCSTSPVAVGAITNATQISAGGVQACALLSGGSVDCWGYNGDGALGDGTTVGPDCDGGCSATPVAVSGLAGATQVAAGNNDTCALLSGGDIDCWGDDNSGQLGDGTTTQTGRDVPMPVSGIP